MKRRNSVKRLPRGRGGIDQIPNRYRLPRPTLSDLTRRNNEPLLGSALRPLIRWAVRPADPLPLWRRKKAEESRLRRRFPVYDPYAEQFKASIREDVPRNHRVCIARKERREVLFASGFGGKRRLRRPKPTLDSQVRCK